jgi:hypothetical protein
VVLALLACAAVFQGFGANRVLAPADALQLVAPWATDPDYVAKNEQLLDQTVQFVPWTFYAKQRLQAGQIPLWDPHAQLGAPFVGNGQSAVFYPTMLLHLSLPETWSWTISAALRLLVAGLGVWALAGHYGLRGGPRLLSGVAFMLCGFNVVWLNHPQMNVMPLLPWAVLVVEKVLVRVTLPRVIVGSVVIAIQFLGGHPATTMHLLLAVALVVGLRLLLRDGSLQWARWGRGTGAVVACVVLGFALAALQWLPLIEYVRNSGAKVFRYDKLVEARSHWINFEPKPLLGLVFPYANGYPPDRITPFEMRLVTHLPNTNELAGGWVGTIPLALALFGVVTLRRRRNATAVMWATIGAVALAIAIKLPVVDHIVRRVPTLNLAQNARMVGVAALALALLSGFGLRTLIEWLRDCGDAPRLRKVLAWSACGIAAVSVLTTVALLVGKGTIISRGIVRAKDRYDADASHEHSWAYVEQMVRRVHTELTLTGVRLLIPAAMLGAGAGLIWWRRRRPGGLIAASAWPWVGLAGIDLLAFGAFYNPGTHREAFFPSAPAIERLRELNEQQPARFAGTFRTLIPETATAFGLDDVRGYDALAPRRYYHWWDHSGIADLPEYMQGYLSRFDKPDHPAWRLLNLGYLVTAPHHPAPSPQVWQPVYGGEDANIYQAAAVRPRAWVAPRAEVYDSADQVLDRVAKMDFDADQVVLLDRQVAWDAKYMSGAEQLEEPGFWNEGARIPAGRRATVQFLGAPAKEGDRPEVIRLQVSGAMGGGWLVLADSYFPGWTASIVGGVSESGRGGSYGQEAAIVPAYGVVRAIRLPPNSGSLRVEFRYRPWSWRIGAMTSASAAVVLLILIGLSLYSSRKATAAEPQNRSGVA